jgi:nitroreductase
MGVYKTILSRRSIRRFQQKQISMDLLKKFVNAARVAPSAANLQPLEYLVVNDKELCNKVFEALGWAAYIKPKWSPSEEERPVAYIIILSNNIQNNWYIRDASLAAENIVLTAEDEGIGSCILCNVNREKIEVAFNIQDNIYVDSVIALGYKAEHPVIVDMKDSMEYYRDENEVLHVPKRKLQDILHVNDF